MPLHCPRCQSVQTDDNQTCINCSEPLPSHTHATPVAIPFADPVRLDEADEATYLPDHDNPIGSDPVYVVQVRRASWKTPALIAVGLLLALIGIVIMLGQPQPAVRHGQSATAPPQMPLTVPPIAATPAPVIVPSALPNSRTKRGLAIMLPLAVNLVSTNTRRHIQVGARVTLTVFTTHTQGHSAALTLTYRRNQGRRTVLTLAQGSLCSTTWTPQMPGKYEFLATALDNQQQAAMSRPVTISVSAPAVQATVTPASPRAMVGLMPNKARLSISPRPIAPRTTPHVSRTTPHVSRTTPHVSRTTPHVSRLVYHVAAAHFPFSRNATVLAAALRRQGLPAVTQRITNRKGKTVFVVETGTYRSLAEVRKAVLILQRSGYPADFYGKP